MKIVYFLCFYLASTFEVDAIKYVNPDFPTSCRLKKCPFEDINAFVYFYSRNLPNSLEEYKEIYLRCAFLDYNCPYAAKSFNRYRFDNAKGPVRIETIPISFLPYEIKEKVRKGEDKILKMLIDDEYKENLKEIIRKSKIYKFSPGNSAFRELKIEVDSYVETKYKELVKNNPKIAFKRYSDLSQRLRTFIEAIFFETGDITTLFESSEFKQALQQFPPDLSLLRAKFNQVEGYMALHKVLLNEDDPEPSKFTLINILVDVKNEKISVSDQLAPLVEYMAGKPFEIYLIAGRIIKKVLKPHDIAQEYDSFKEENAEIQDAPEIIKFYEQIDEFYREQSSSIFIILSAKLETTYPNYLNDLNKDSLMNSICFIDPRSELKLKSWQSEVEFQSRDLVKAVENTLTLFPYDAIRLNCRFEGQVSLVSSTLLMFNGCDQMTQFTVYSEYEATISLGGIESGSFLADKVIELFPTKITVFILTQSGHLVVRLQEKEGIIAKISVQPAKVVNEYDTVGSVIKAKGFPSIKISNNERFFYKILIGFLIVISIFLVATLFVFFYQWRKVSEATQRQQSVSQF